MIPMEPVCSGSASLVPMMQSTDLWDCNDWSAIRRLDRSRLRAVFLQRKMGAATVVILNEAFQVSVQGTLIKDDPVIQALAANGADDPLDIRTLPRGARRRKRLFDAHCFHLIY